MQTNELEAKIARLREQAQRAQAALDEALSEQAEIGRQLRRQEIEAEVAALEVNARDLYDEDPKYRGEANYILPFGRDFGKWDVHDVENHPFGKDWLSGMYALLCLRLDENRTYPTRIVFGSGTHPGARWTIGNSWTFRHDQTNGRLGEYQVVGIVIYDADGNVALKEGDVPKRKLSMATFK